MVTGFDVEVLYLALKRGYRVKEVPVEWSISAAARSTRRATPPACCCDVLKVRCNDLQGKYREATRPRRART